MSVVNVEFRANANFSDLVAQVNAANAAVQRLNMTFDSLQKKKIDGIMSGFNNALTASGQFTAQQVRLTSESEKFGKALDRQKLHLREYAREWQNFHRTQGGMIRDLARQQTMLERSMVVTRGRDTQGRTLADVITPTGLDGSLGTRAMQARKELQILNKVLNDGATSLINWGKNTQWAGRQLTVGLTVPLTLLGGAAAKMAYDMDKELTRVVKVYGNSINSMLSGPQIQKLREDLTGLSKSIATTYGQTAQETLGLAADLAAAGKTGEELTASITQTTRLATLGEVDRQEAMKATLALQTAFKQNSGELAESINFLNAVENQTSTSLNDLVEAIPKAGPVVKGLGGDVKDLALMMVAMREGGIPAAEGANAIKSGLASLINPTKQAREMLQGYNIDIDKIQKAADGKLIPMVTGFKKALDGLDSFTKSQVIEQIFGKFQFARMTALFENLGSEGSQTLEVMKLMGASSEELGQIADRELKTLQESISGQFTRALETLKVNLADIGQGFLELGTKALNVVNWMIEKFNALPDVVKKGIGGIGLFTAVIGPIIMTTGVLGNLLGYLIKGIGMFKSFGNSGIRSFELLDAEMVATRNAADVMAQSMYDSKTATAVLNAEIEKLVASLADLGPAAQSSATKMTAALNQAQTATTMADKEKQMLVDRAAVGGPIVNPQYKPPSGSKDPFAYRGNAFSHLYASSKIWDDGKSGLPIHPDNLYSTGSLVGDPAGNANEFQKAMKENFMGSSIVVLSDSMKDLDAQRKAMLESMARGNKEAAQLMTSLTAEDRARLLPTMETFKAVNIRHAAFWKTLGDMATSGTAAVAEQGRAVVLSIRQAFAEGKTAEQAYGQAFSAMMNDTSTGLAQNIRAMEAEFDKIIASSATIDDKLKAAVAGLVAKQEAAGKAAVRSVVVGGTAANPRTLDYGLTLPTGIGTDGTAGVRSSDGALAQALYNDNVREATERLERAGQSMETAGKTMAAAAVAEEKAGITENVAADKMLVASQNMGRTGPERGGAGSWEPEGAAVVGPGSPARRGGRLKAVGKGVGVAAGIGLLTGGSSMDGALGSAAGIAGGALSGAMLGSIIPGAGTAIGAGVGALVAAIPILVSASNEATAEMRTLGEVGSLALDNLGAKFIDIADTPLTTLIGQTKEARTQIEMLYQAFKEAPEGSTEANFVNLLKGEGSQTNMAGLIGDKVTNLIAAGMKPEDIRSYIQAAMQAAGKDGQISAILNEIGPAISQSIGESLKNQIVSGGLGSGVLAANAPWEQMAGIKAGTGTLSQVNPEEVERLVTALQGWANNTTIADFNTEMAKLGGEMVPLAAQSIANLDERWRPYAENVMNSGGDMNDVLGLIALNAQRVNVDLDTISRNPWEIRMYLETFEGNQKVSGGLAEFFNERFDARKKSIQNSVPGSAYQTEEQFNKRKERMKKAQQDQLDATKDHYDKLIEAEKKKEAELKKVQEAEKRRLDREKQMRDMQISYNEAIASGNFGQAALIKNNMSADRAAWNQEDKQRAEDEKAQSRLEKLEAAKEKAVDREQARLDRIEEMNYKANKQVTTSAKKAADERVANEDRVRREMLAILDKYPGDVDRALKEIGAKSATWKAEGVNVGKMLASAVGTELKSLPKDVVQAITKNLPDAPWDAIGQAIQGKIMGGKGGNRLFAQAIRTLNAWRPGYETTSGGSIPIPGWGGKQTGTDNRAAGGYISGKGHGTSDDIPARLSNGEFVMTNAAVNHYGKGLMDQINQRKFAAGGYVESVTGGSLSRIFQGAAMAAIGSLGARGTVGGAVNAGVDGGATGTAGGAGSTIKGSGIGAEIAKMSLKYVGVPYSYTGGSPEDGWGCAPFVHWLYAQRGYNIPGGSLSYNQYRGISERPDRSQLAAGDLVFFKYANGVNTQNPINHVGMALNGSTMIHAANPKRGTVVSGIDWANYVAAARPIGLDGKKNFAKGGIAMLGKAGEFVVNDSAVQKYGTGFMNAINNQTYHGGGLITESGPQRGAGTSEAMYNFNIYGGNNNPEEIANMVMQKMKIAQKRVTSGR